MRYLLGAGALALTAGGAAAQGVSITPQLGAYIPASDFYELRDQANEIRLEKEGTLGLGLVVELGWLRGSIAYATGSTLSERGVSDRENIGNGSVLAAAADLVIRPLPRVLIQPYLLGGIGLLNAGFNADDGVGEAFPEEDTEVAAHVGLGADLMLGRIGIMAEITDFISRDPDGDWAVHDAFAMVGLKFRL
jgi:hypothetical protein